MTRILGIDPGTTTVGYALLEKQGHTFTILDFGVLHTQPKLPLAEKLSEIGRDIKILLEKYQPQRVGVEKLYFTTNTKTGIDVAHARGVILYECFSAGVPLLEFTPLQVKKAVTGNGQAQKKQVQRALQMIFRLEEIPKPDDAADALALAYMTALQAHI